MTSARISESAASFGHTLASVLCSTSFVAFSASGRFSVSRRTAPCASSNRTWRSTSVGMSSISCSPSIGCGFGRRRGRNVAGMTCGSVGSIRSQSGIRRSISSNITRSSRRGEVRPEAEVCAESERNVAVLAVRADVQDIGFVEGSLVPVRRAVHQHQLVARSDLSAVQFVVFSCRAAHVEDWRHPADKFVDRSRSEQLRSLEQQRSLVGMEREVPDDRARDRAGCLGSTVQNQDRFVQDLLRAPTLRRPHRDEVVLRIGATLFDECGRDVDELEYDGCQAGVRRVWRTVWRCLTCEEHDLLRPVSDLLPLLARVAEQIANDDGGQRRGDGIDGFALPERHDRVEDLGRNAPHARFVVADTVWREATDDEVALVLVLGVVHVDHGLVAAQVDVGSGTVERRVARAVALDREDIVVARDDPELLERIPEHRCLVA